MARWEEGEAAVMNDMHTRSALSCNMCVLLCHMRNMNACFALSCAACLRV